MSEYSWKSVPLSGDTPIARRYFTVTAHEERFYLFGGHKPSKEATDDLSYVDPSSSFFFFLLFFFFFFFSSFFSFFFSFSFSSSFLFLFFLSFFFFSFFLSFSIPFFLSLETSEFHHLSPSGATPPPRGGHSAVLHESHLYIFGGISGKTSLNDLWVVNLSATKKRKEVEGDQAEAHLWQQIVPTGEEGEVWPPVREFHSAVVFNNAMFVFGGSNGIKKYKNDFYKFDFGKEPHLDLKERSDWRIGKFGGFGLENFFSSFFFLLATKKFSVVTFQPEGAPEGRAGHLAFLRDNELIVFGGYCGDGGFTYLSDINSIPLGKAK